LACGFQKNIFNQIPNFSHLNITNINALQVKAFDKDSGANGDVRYYINSGNVDGAFKIDSVSGVLSTNRKLDREVSFG